ncbi:MAG: cell envelope integrity protein TolA, partial [Hafnia sp.]
MVNASEKNDKLNRSVIVSIILHIVLIALLVWGSMMQDSTISAGGGGGSAIDAVMVDSGAMVKEYNDRQQQ